LLTNALSSEFADLLAILVNGSGGFLPPGYVNEHQREETAATAKLVCRNSKLYRTRPRYPEISFCPCGRMTTARANFPIVLKDF
jgi:hypothetical protein